MARITYGVYLDNAPNCYIISNADTEFAEYAVPECFTNPPIKLTVLETGSWGLERLFDVTENPWNHPELVENLEQALRGELPGWALTGVNISANGLYLIYQTDHRVDGDLSNDGGQVCAYGSFKLRFVVEHTDGRPPKIYDVECYDGHNKIKTMETVTPTKKAVRITEYVGNHKHRILELREDNHGQPFIPGKQYCLITEY